MKLEFAEAENAVAVIRPQGRLNMLSAPALRDAVADTVADGRLKIVIDLVDTSFVDSSGLGALIGGLKTARSSGGDLRIARAGDQIMAVLRLTNLHRVLRPHPTVEAAYGDS